MKLARLGEPGRETPVLVSGDIYYDLSGVIRDIDPGTLAEGALDAIRAAEAQGGLPVLEGASSLRVGSPIARPSAILCIGLNYAAHAAESGMQPPADPVLFLKTPKVDSTGQRNTIENVLGGVMWQRSVDQGSRLIDGSKCGKCGRQAHQSARLVELWALRQAPSSQSCCPMVGSISRSRGVALAH